LPHCVVAAKLTVGNADCIHNTAMEPDDREEELEEAASLSQPAKRPRQPPPPPKHQQHLSESGVVSKEQDSYRTAYAGFTFEPIPSTGRPGTPHRFFAESYLVRRTEDGGSSGDDGSGERKDDTISPEQPAARRILPVLHKNANGLVVVTVGSSCVSSSMIDCSTLLPSLTGIDVVASEAPSDSLGGKRKKQAKMLKGKSVQHVVQPHDTMAALRFDGEQNNSHDDDDDEPQSDDNRSGETAHVLCGVWGTVLEVNPNLTPELLRSDPALNGYLAIVLPTGPFPPPATSS
jgi:hypothetical protein